MDDRAITGIVSVLLAVTGLAIIAALVSQKSNTTGVLGDFGNAIKKMLCVALSPVTGTNCGSLTERVTSTINFGNIP